RAAHAEVEEKAVYREQAGRAEQGLQLARAPLQGTEAVGPAEPRPRGADDRGPGREQDLRVPAAAERRIHQALSRNRLQELYHLVTEDGLVDERQRNRRLSAARRCGPGSVPPGRRRRPGRSRTRRARPRRAGWRA